MINPKKVIRAVKAARADGWRIAYGGWMIEHDGEKYCCPMSACALYAGFDPRGIYGAVTAAGAQAVAAQYLKVGQLEIDRWIRGYDIAAVNRSHFEFPHLFTHATFDGEKFYHTLCREVTSPTYIGDFIK
jgi:hypothetical protein